MAAKIWLDRNPPVRCNTTDRALPRRTDTEGLLRIVRQWPIAAELKIEDVVEKAVDAEPGNLLRVDLVDEGLGSRRRRQSRADVRKAPGGYRVPDVLDCRVVVGGHAPQQIMSFDVDRVRVTNISVVPTETAGHAIICPLNECPEIVGDPATGKEARLLEREVVVRAEMRSGAALLSSLGMGISRCLEHHRKRRACPIAAPRRVAPELEAAASRRQLEERGMTV